jgi:hypothetical protein
VYFRQGVEAIAAETVYDPDLHHDCLLAIDAGIEAASRGELERVRLVMESRTSGVNDAADAQALLERIRLEYLSAYQHQWDASGVLM